MYIVLLTVARMIKNTHIKGKLLDQAMVLFNCDPFQNETSLKGKNLLPERILSFKSSSLGYGKSFLQH